MQSAEPQYVHKIAIVGFTPSRRFAPAVQDGWEVWGMNNLHVHEDPAQFTRWFDLHDLDTVRSDPAHLAWLTAGASGLPVYMWDPHPEWPTAVPYPREHVLSAFAPYFTNSVSWMTALAILELTGGRPVDPGVEKPVIGIYGVDMAATSEYGSQRPSCEYYIGLAQGLGIEVIIPQQSDLLKTASQYGVPGGEALRAKLDEREFELQNGIAQADQQIAQAEQQLMGMREHRAALRGALENTTYVRGVWTMPSIKRDEEPAEAALAAAPPGA